MQPAVQGPDRPSTTPSTRGSVGESQNELVLAGRVSAAPEERELPSGDVIATFRVIVDRPPRARPDGGGPGASVDVIDCVAWAAGVRRTARGLAPGDVVTLRGSLRRRFWRGPTGATSRYEVEVAALKRLRRAG